MGREKGKEGKNKKSGEIKVPSPEGLQQRGLWEGLEDGREGGIERPVGRVITRFGSTAAKATAGHPEGGVTRTA